MFTFICSHQIKIQIVTYFSCNRSGPSLTRTQPSNSAQSKQNPETSHHNGIPHIILCYSALDSQEIRHQEVPNLHIIFILKLGLRIPTYLGWWNGQGNLEVRTKVPAFILPSDNSSGPDKVSQVLTVEAATTYGALIRQPAGLYASHLFSSQHS